MKYPVITDGSSSTRVRGVEFRMQSAHIWIIPISPLRFHAPNGMIDLTSVPDETHLSSRGVETLPIPNLGHRNLTSSSILPDSQRGSSCSENDSASTKCNFQRRKLTAVSVPVLPAAPELGRSDVLRNPARC